MFPDFEITILHGGGKEIVFVHIFLGLKPEQNSSLTQSAITSGHTDITRSNIKLEPSDTLS